MIDVSGWRKRQIMAEDDDDIQDYKKPWIGLTDEDKSLFSSWLDHKTDDEVFSAIEERLKDLNT